MAFFNSLLSQLPFAARCLETDFQINSTEQNKRQHICLLRAAILVSFILKFMPNLKWTNQQEILKKPTEYFIVYSMCPEKECKSVLLFCFSKRLAALGILKASAAPEQLIPNWYPTDINKATKSVLKVWSPCKQDGASCFAWQVFLEKMIVPSYLTLLNLLHLSFKLMSLNSSECDSPCLVGKGTRVARDLVEVLLTDLDAF